MKYFSTYILLIVAIFILIKGGCMAENVYTKIIPAREAEIVEFPSELRPELRECLVTQGAKGLYTHQAEMFTKAMAGENVIITTGTSSGKTIAFILPIIQKVLSDPSTRAIICYPTKALTADQFRTLKKFANYFGNKRLNIGVFDGDTEAKERKRILNMCNIILTNPDMLNTLLPKHANSNIRFLITNLKFVVLDEAHTYLGIFGSNVANIFRRLHRLCKYYGSEPVFMLSSATISNATGFASKLCFNQQFELIDKDGSPMGEKHYHIVYGDNKVIARLISYLTNNGSRFIEFEKSRKGVELIVNQARASLSNNHKKDINGYCATYKPSERKNIQTNLANGTLIGVCSTNALELGIDVGDVDNVLINGYPGTKASFYQQSGRAGRKQQLSNTYLFLRPTALDSYIASDPEFLFQGNSESAVIDPDNLYIEMAHIRAAAAELPLTLEDLSLFPDAGDIIPLLVEEGQLKEVDGKFLWNGNSIPTQDFNIRNIENTRFELLEAKKDGLSLEEMKSKKWTVTEMPESRAYKELCLGSIYHHNGEMYQITSFNKKRKCAVCKLFDGDYYTVSYENSRLIVNQEEENNNIGNASIGFGEVTAETTTLGFKKLSLINDENLGYEALEEPLFRSFNTEGFWITTPTYVEKSLNELTKDKVSPAGIISQYIDSVGYAIKNAAQLVIMADSSDLLLGQITPNAEHLNVGICLFDNYEGGLGFAQKAFELAPDIVNKAIQTVEGCSCKSGCPICIGRNGIRKEVVVWCLKSLLEEQAPLDDIVLPEPVYSDLPSTERFNFETIEESWNEAVTKAKSVNIDVANFISDSVKSVRRTGSALNLELINEGTVNIASLSANKQRIERMIRQLYLVPNNFKLEIYTNNPSNISIRKKDKLRERFSYSNL